MEKNVFFEMYVLIPNSDEKDEELDKKIGNNNHWTHTRPIYFASLDEKYQKVLKDKQVNYRRYENMFRLTISGFCSINEVVEVIKTFEGKIESYYVDKFFDEKVKKAVNSLLLPVKETL